MEIWLFGSACCTFSVQCIWSVCNSCGNQFYLLLYSLETPQSCQMPELFPQPHIVLLSSCCVLISMQQSLEPEVKLETRCLHSQNNLRVEAHLPLLWLRLQIQSHGHPPCMHSSITHLYVRDPTLYAHVGAYAIKHTHQCLGSPSLSVWAV